MAGDKRTLKFLAALETAEFKKGINSIKKSLKNIGSYIKGAFAAGSLLAFGKSAIQAGKDFEDAMARVKAVSNASTEDFKAMNEEAKKLGSSTIYSATQAANALEFLTRNGLTAKEATQALGGVLQLAQANAIELAEAADIVTNTLNMFGMKTSEVATVNNILSSTASHTATNVIQLYEALTNAAPAAHTLGFTLDETSAALGALANRGVKGANAGTALRMALVKMSDPLIVKKLNDAGVAVNEYTMRQEGLLKTLEKLKNANLSFEDLVGIFSQKGAVGIQQMVGAYEDIVEIYGKVNREAANGTAARMFKEGVGSVRKELDLLKNQFNVFLIDMGNKTSGMVKGAVRLLQNLITNFKTVGGTIANIASAAIPLLGNRMLTFLRQTKKLIDEVKAGTAAATATMGGWITAIASLVTWVGTALVGAWNRVHKPIKDANKEMEVTNGKIAKMKGEAEGLIEQLGPDSDKKTLAGVVSQLKEMFPDFATAIQSAATEAQKTGNWDKLKSVLQDIVNLQATVLAKNANQKIVEAQTAGLAANLKANHSFGNGIYAFGLENEYLKKALRKTKGVDVKYAYQDIAEILIANADPEKAGKEIYKYLHAIGVEFSEGAATEIAKFATSDDFYKAAIEAVGRVKNGQSEIDAFNSAFNTATTATTTGGGGSGGELEGDKKKINDAIDDYINTKAGLKEMLDKHAISEKEYKKELDKLEDSTLEAIVTTGKYKEILKELARIDFNIDDLFTKVAVNSGNELMKDFLKQGDKTKQKENLGRYAVGAPEARGTSLDYSKTQAEIIGEEYKIAGKYADDLQDKITGLEEAIKNGDFDDVLGEAIELLGDLNYALSQTLEETNDLGHATVLAESIEKIDKQIEDLKGNVSNTITDIAKSFERCYNAITDMFEAFGGEMTEEAKESWERFFSVINGGVQIFETLKEVCEAVKIVNDLLSKKRAVDASKQILENAAITESEKLKAEAETAAAVAGAASSSAGIPGVGVALAIAGISAIIAALASSKNKFSNGGVVGGNSYSGDNVIARVNSGEGILTAKGVKNLSTLYNNQGSVGQGNVEFKIKGQDLVGVLKNYEKIKRG